MLFCRWKLRRPQRMQSVCVLFRRLPKLPVPFPCKNHGHRDTEQHVSQTREDTDVDGGGGSSSAGVPFLRCCSSAQLGLGGVAAWGRRGVKP